MRLSPQPLPVQCFRDLRVLRRQSGCLFKELTEGETKLTEQTVSDEMISCGSVVLKLWRTAHNFFCLIWKQHGLSIILPNLDIEGKKIPLTINTSSFKKIYIYLIPRKQEVHRLSKKKKKTQNQKHKQPKTPQKPTPSPHGKKDRWQPHMIISIFFVDSP